MVKSPEGKTMALAAGELRVIFIHDEFAGDVL